MNTLRRILLLVVALTAMIPMAEAQLRYGFRFGGSFAGADIKDAGEFSLSNKSGFSGGLMLEYQLPKCGFAADVALLYTRFNTRLQHDGKPAESFGRNFIEIPLHLKYKFWLPAFNNLFGPMVYTGPSLMARIGHSCHEPLSTKKMQPGWDVGIGFDIVNFIQISGGYRFGLGNAVDSFTGHPDASLRTNGWNISASLLFDF